VSRNGTNFRSSKSPNLLPRKPNAVVANILSGNKQLYRSDPVNIRNMFKCVRRWMIRGSFPPEVVEELLLQLSKSSVLRKALDIRFHHKFRSSTWKCRGSLFTMSFKAEQSFTMVSWASSTCPCALIRHGRKRRRFDSPGHMLSQIKNKSWQARVLRWYSWNVPLLSRSAFAMLGAWPRFCSLDLWS
jgi:hypothetical protein